MAKGAQKRIAASNNSAVRTLQYGFLLSNTIHLLLNFWVWRSPATYRWQFIALYVVSEAIAGFIAWQLTCMAHAGDDLRQSGLTAYMFDVVYITWFVHIATALVSRRFWWTYAVIPMYASYLLYTHILVPPAQPSQTAQQPVEQPQRTKRQAKQQARANRGSGK
ncbi:hypothetical protein MYAM1_000146 [Malassezia yamatoensis]|uniref:Uncharacterized protein n=1 Tax=Malassezia yamatoensis TaxID=253288 RepID=A0AAJ5YQQ6_9BASI|nr:hypothetical protein MYAM1_000146 [Malassezia yamatoensis]